jgi:ATP synthase protein I
MWGHAMSKNKPPNLQKSYLEFSRQVGLKESRKLRAQRVGIKTIWYGLGMMGLIGWSIAMPTLIGIFLGVWLDEQVPITESWTLILLIIGMIIGCLNAWRWMKKEDKKIRDEQEKKDE